MTVTIVTDSCAYLPAAVAERWGIEVVSLYVNLDGETRRETDITDYGAYFDRLTGAPELPRTSQPSIGDFLAVYEPLLAAGHDVLSMHLSGAMSGTVNAATQARDQLGANAGRVRVLDTHLACGAEAMMAQSAAAVLAAGGSVEAAVARAERLRGELRFWFALDTLEYLRRGGRIGGARAWLGSALKIKPILSVAEEITPVERVRSTRRAFDRIVALLEGARHDGADAWAIQHIQAHDQAERLADRGRQIFGCEPLFCSEIGPVIGTHIGPGMFGAGAFPSALIS